MVLLFRILRRVRTTTASYDVGFICASDSLHLITHSKSVAEKDEEDFITSELECRKNTSKPGLLFQDSIDSIKGRFTAHCSQNYTLKRKFSVTEVVALLDSKLHVICVTGGEIGKRFVF